MEVPAICALILKVQRHLRVSYEVCKGTQRYDIETKDPDQTREINKSHAVSQVI